MKSSTLPLVSAALWSLARIALLLFYIDSEAFPWGQVHSNLILVWFATPGIAGIVFALQAYFEGPAGSRSTRSLFLVNALDAFMGFAVLILGLVFILSANQELETLNTGTLLAWNVLVPALSVLINGGLLVMLYNQAFKPDSEA